MHHLQIAKISKRHLAAMSRHRSASSLGADGGRRLLIVCSGAIGSKALVANVMTHVALFDGIREAFSKSAKQLHGTTASLPAPIVNQHDKRGPNRMLALSTDREQSRTNQQLPLSFAARAWNRTASLHASS